MVVWGAIKRCKRNDESQAPVITDGGCLRLLGRPVGREIGGPAEGDRTSCCALLNVPLHWPLRAARPGPQAVVRRSGPPDTGNEQMGTQLLAGEVRPVAASW